MKLLGAKLFFVFIFNVFSVTAQEVKINSPFYLQLYGIVKEINIVNGKQKLEKLDSAAIEVIDAEGKEIFSAIYDTKKRVPIKLPFGQNFTVIVSKDGYVSKCFTVNTVVPKQKLAIYNFPFEVTLFKKIEGLNIEIVDPVAIVQFFSKEKKFDYDYQYTEEVNAALKAKYKDFYIMEETK